MRQYACILARLSVGFGFLPLCNKSDFRQLAACGLSCRKSDYTNSIKINRGFVIHSSGDFMKTIKNFLFFISAFFALFSFADCADCEAYKMQVSSDCDSIISSCDSAIFDCQSAAGNAELFAGYYGSNSTERVALIQVAESASRAEAALRTLKGFAQSIKTTAQSLQCNSSSNVVSSCDCATYLQSIVTLLTSTKSTIDSISITLGSIEGKTVIQELDLIETTNQDLVDILTEFLLWDGSDSLPISINDIYNSITNSYNVLYNLYIGMGNAGDNTTAFTSKFWYNNINNSLSQISLQSGYDSNTKIRQLSLVGAVKGGFVNLARLLASLNNYSYTNLSEYSRINLSLVSVNTNIVSLSEKFSIFNDFVFSADAPLSMYTDMQTDGSYHDYLTNYYIKVSKGQQSGSDNYTNWFSRIEILLASLVFRDDGTNFVDDAENTSQMENTLSQSVDTLSQAVSLPQNVTGKIDNMGQSFLGLLGEWRTIVSGNSLPSQFVFCDINLGSQSRDSSGGSSVSSFRLETSLDSGEFRQFLDFCHAVTTILFTMLFVWLSVMLLSFLLASLAKLVQFCYLVYSALFGG